MVNCKILLRNIDKSTFYSPNFYFHYLVHGEVAPANTPRTIKCNRLRGNFSYPRPSLITFHSASDVTFTSPDSFIVIDGTNMFLNLTIFLFSVWLAEGVFFQSFSSSLFMIIDSLKIILMHSTNIYLGIKSEFSVYFSCYKQHSAACCEV